MAFNVFFLKGTAAEYTAAVKNNNTFYFTTDDNQLYVGDIKLSNAGEIAAAVTRIAANEGSIKTITQQLESLTSGGAGSIAEQITAAKTELQGQIGTLGDLETTEKTDLVKAINEVKKSVEAGGTASVITIDEEDSETYAKVYTLKQGTSTIGSINIPKDMVVKSGEVVKNPEGQPEGTYIVITLANATNDKVYVNVGTLVDIYKATENASQVQIAIDATTRQISASIVAGSIGTKELADDAVTTAKIAKANVTKEKLDTAVQGSLDKADSAVQAADVTTGAENGTIAVKGADVKVKGLGTAAYEDKAAFEAAGEAAKVQNNLNAYKETTDAAVQAASEKADQALTDAKEYAKEYADGLAKDYATADQGKKADTAVQAAEVTTGTVNGTINVKGAAVPVFGLGSAAYEDKAAFDAAGVGQKAADKALEDAKKYTDSALTWGTIA